MLDFLKPDDDAINILKTDHDKVKGLFDQFEKADTLREKKKIVAQAIMELKIHATIEEEIFYPALRRQKVEKDLLNEADEEHHVAKLLIAELEQMKATDDHFEAKFTVLSENIRHHIKEEEGEMFLQARRTGIDFTILGEQLLARKKELMKNGIPPCAEEKLMARTKARDDSPAAAARSSKNGRKTAGKTPTARRKPIAKAKGKATAIRKAPAKKLAARGQR